MQSVAAWMTPPELGAGMAERASQEVWPPPPPPPTPPLDELPQASRRWRLGDGWLFFGGGVVISAVGQGGAGEKGLLPAMPTGGASGEAVLTATLLLLGHRSLRCCPR